MRDRAQSRAGRRDPGPGRFGRALLRASLAEAIRRAARERNLALPEPQDFKAIPGQGLRATVNGQRLASGNRRLVPAAANLPPAREIEAAAKTLLFVERAAALPGELAATHTLRPEVPTARAAVRALGIRDGELLTGDNECGVPALAEQLGVRSHAGLLPVNKIKVCVPTRLRGSRW